MHRPLPVGQGEGGVHHGVDGPVPVDEQGLAIVGVKDLFVNFKKVFM